MEEPRCWEDATLDECEFSVRVVNQLSRWRSGVTLGELDKTPDEVLLKVPHFGRKSLREVRELIESVKPLPPKAFARPDIVRVLRLVEYVGQRHLVEQTVARSIHGTWPKTDAGLRITAVTIGEFPESLEAYAANLKQD